MLILAVPQVRLVTGKDADSLLLCGHSLAIADNIVDKLATAMHPPLPEARVLRPVKVRPLTPSPPPLSFHSVVVPELRVGMLPMHRYAVCVCRCTSQYKSLPWQFWEWFVW